MNRKRRICLMAGGHVASTPRLVKEADALYAAGHEVLVLGVQSVASVAAMDEELQRSKPWPVRNADCRSRWTVVRGLIRLQRNAAEKRIRAGNASLQWHCRALAPWHGAVLPEIERFRPDLVIAHSLAGLTVAGRAAEQFGCGYAFDMEDYHPGEAAGDLSVSQNHLAREVLRRLLPGARYVTASSPGIAEEAERVFGRKGIVVILNVFPREEIRNGVPHDRQPGGLSLYWFSQTIGLDRGLQDVVVACGQLGPVVQLHLRGNIPASVRLELERLVARHGVRERCHLHPWCAPAEMFARMAEHDVGLALETGYSLNRDLAITNKILYYPLAGLAVAATRTRGQVWAMEQMPGAGFLYDSGNGEELARGLKRWRDDPAALRSARAVARRVAEERFCWERAAPRFLDAVERALAKPRP